ncbi:MAG: FAD-dependent oxidoreductase [Mesorhizobium sp.]|uniref:FAD-dependent oxidoreductase n=1 Tax=Mesorhizobium sp. TaxID=1871066 RepID=UPI000FE6DC5F|nr:FAD-dependent oxidoreductase [Mesorhizobium sp.]RWE22874.1 MAG: FAD-dependent oxidoreductase [Mesorhizobium sp.]
MNARELAVPAGYEADVVVVGGGGSGLFAAVEAAELGRKVIVLEKNPKPGGMTNWAIGSLSSSASPMQVAIGIKDTPEDHFADMALFHGGLLPRDNPELRKVFVENVPATLKKLLDMGVVFFGPMPEPPHRVPRMHNVLPNARAYGHALYRRARQLGVDVRFNHRARHLMCDRGRVVGVEAEANGTAFRFSARSGVVLAGGDFSANAEMKRSYAGDAIAQADALVVSSTGDAHQLALEVGAEIVNGDIVGGPQLRFVPPKVNLVRMLPPSRSIALLMRWSMAKLPQWLIRPFIMMFLTTILEPQRKLYESGAILVNKEGRRFADECDKPQLAVPQQPGKEAFIVLDGQLARKFNSWPHYISTAPGVAYAYLSDYKRNRKDVYHQSNTIEGLAKKIGVPAAALAETFADYNRNPRKGSVGLRKLPFVALGPVRSWVFTEGGLRISPKMEVLSATGKPILGLYAAGQTGQGGIILEGHGHHLGWAFTSGRLAGRAAALGAGNS